MTLCKLFIFTKQKEVSKCSSVCSEMLKLNCIFVLTNVTAKFHQITYTECDRVIGYWSPWSEWSTTCQCKTKYEVTRYGPRFVKERRRQCYCGKDNVLSGCDTWCGRPHDFTDEKYCDESVTFEWAEWGKCGGNGRKTRQVQNCTATGCNPEAMCKRAKLMTETQQCPHVTTVPTCDNWFTF